MVAANSPVNLGLGAPDFEAYPKTIIDALNQITVSGDYSMNQYTRGPVFIALNGHSMSMCVI